MSGLYLYALLDSRPPGVNASLGLARRPREANAGLARLRVVRCGRLFAVVSDVSRPPKITPRTLRAHDAVVRRLATLVDALLPVRFGTVVSSPDELARLIGAREGELREALRLVKGREQMTLRVYGLAATDDAKGDREEKARGDHATGDMSENEASQGPGTRHLRRLQIAHRRRTSVPEIAALRDACAPFVHAERVERHDVAAGPRLDRQTSSRRRSAPGNALRSSPSPTLIASVHHLIDRRAATRYRAAVTRACRAHALERTFARSRPRQRPPLPSSARIRVVVRGPWPPYAFAPDAVA